jgi:hypothetical protein
MTDRTDTGRDAVERYDVIERHLSTGLGAEMEENEYGEWVKYDDYAALLAVKEKAEAEASEALNQLDSARHSEECLKKRCEELWAEDAALRGKLQEAGQALTEIERLYYTEGKDASWRAVQMRAIANATLATLDQPKEGDRNDG